MQYPAKHVSTVEFASQLGVKTQTVHKALCLKGHYMGVKPIKLPNRRLRWPGNAVDKIIKAAEE
jgi:hypothetical protein